MIHLLAPNKFSKVRWQGKVPFKDTASHIKVYCLLFEQKSLFSQKHAKCLQIFPIELEISTNIMISYDDCLRNYDLALLFPTFMLLANQIADCSIAGEFIPEVPDSEVEFPGFESLFTFVFDFASVCFCAE